jgi:hypothetical protein
MHLPGNSSSGGKFSVSMLENTPEHMEFATLIANLYSEMSNARVKGELYPSLFTKVNKLL